MDRPSQPFAPLFPAYATHIEVQCWQCGHVATLKPEDAPRGISEHEFSRRAKCRRGAGWPHLQAFPRPVSGWFSGDKGEPEG